MENLKKELEELLSKHIEDARYVDLLDAIDELLTDYKILKENDFNSINVENGNHYLVKFKSGNFGEVWYNAHGQWMYEFRNVEDSIDKIYTPKIK